MRSSLDPQTQAIAEVGNGVIGVTNLGTAVKKEGEGEAPEAQLRIGVDGLAWAAVIVIAAVTRLLALGTLPLGLGDGARAFAAWQVSQGRLPGFWSGDLTVTLTAVLFKLFGASDGLARLVAALLGLGLVAVLILYRPLVGRAPALIAACFLALSPVAIAVSRSLSSYAAGATFAVAAAAALLTFIERPRPAPLAWLAAIVGLGLSTDASFLVFLLTACLFCIVEGLWKRRREFELAFAYLRERPALRRSTLLIGLAGGICALTRFGIALERLRSGATLSWSQAFTASAGAPPWHFVLGALLAYEPLLVLAGIAASAFLLLRAHAELSISDRFLIYWLASALVFPLISSRREAGQLLLSVAPLAVLTAIGCVRCLSAVEWSALRPAIAPFLLAIPAFIYVLLIFEGTSQGQSSSAQQLSVLLLLFGAAGLLILGTFWARDEAPALLTVAGLCFGTVFALHTLARVGFGNGDEFLLGAVASANAPALGGEVALVAPSLNGAVSLWPSFAQPLAWYTRGDPFVRLEAANSTSAGIVQPVDQAQPPAFQALIPGSEIARVWYPSSFDSAGILRWLLYRQAWEPVHSTSAQFLIRSEQP